MKMEISKGESNEGCYKRFVIQEIVDPVKFYAIEYGNDRKMPTKPHISQKDVRELKYWEKTHIGQIIAVKYRNELHRGLITDIYNRQQKPSFYVWLMDKGNSIDTSFDSVYQITNSQLKKEKNKAFEIIENGVCPVSPDLLVSSVTLDCNMNRNNLDSILLKRKSDEWSPAAFKFVNNLFSTNKNIYVKCADINGVKIAGKVHYRREYDGQMISLAQTLCDNDFAFLCENDSEISAIDICRGIKYLQVIKNAAEAKSKELNGITSQRTRGPYEDKFDSGDSCKCSEASTSSYSCSNKSFDYSKEQANASRVDSFSPSWILKKMNKFSSSASFESFTDSCRHLDQSDKSVAGPKVNLFRIVEKNARLYDKHQH